MAEKKETVFIWPVRIYFEDTDTGGIVFYANYLKFFERARTEWLRHLGIGQQVLAQTEELMFVVKNTSIDYHAAAKLDDELAISVTVGKIGSASVHFAQQAWRINKGEPVLICSGKVLVACVNTYSLRPKAMPQALHAKLLTGLHAN
jgi:acyl-CoA thioester hydrolase